MTAREQFLSRFRKSGEPHLRPSDRRGDYKGERGRLNLRLRKDLLADLELIKTVTGVEKTQFVEDVLTEAVRVKLNSLRQSHDATAWETLVRTARGLGAGKT